MERTLLRMLAAATAAAALSASGFTMTAVAQSDQQPAAAQSDQQPTAAEPATHAEQVKHWTSLRLTADQEKDWGPFEAAVKDAQEARLAALQKEQSGNLSPMDRNAAQVDRLQQSQANLEKIVEAAKPLYASLDGAQKQKFIALGRKLMPERGQFAKAIRRLGKGD
jgi:zinc resistance-associated protein